ncbi:MAG: glycosyltransferase [Chitinophagaceae bacterium]|nr:MAG: glycosyltransferase [Chitinophagaceae bacterium]
MHRICTTLVEAGFDVTLVGRKVKSSIPLPDKPFQQQRLTCFFNKGFAFYAEYNLRLFFFLLRKKMDGICAIDLDTILPCLFVSKLKGIRRVYDAHEYFTELKEVRTRPIVKQFWLGVEKFSVPKFSLGYTVSKGLANEFKNKYSRNYLVIRNLPRLQPLSPGITREKIVVYQGAVNEARGFEYLVPAMKTVSYKLIICGDGNFMTQLKELIREHGVEEKIELKGMMLPEELRQVAQKATLGIGLAEKDGINQFYALPNKFLEYMHAGLPQVAMNFPEYQKINKQYPIAVLLDNLSVKKIAETINQIIEDDLLLSQMRENALRAREIYCWQEEENKLLQFYQQFFN